MTAIRLAGVTKRFGSTLAVDAVRLEIAAGELFFLLGPSGCGKTTLLRMVAGFTAPDTGQVYFDDQLANAIAPQHRNCGMVFQNYALWPHLSVAENVAFGLDVRHIAAGERRQRVREALAMVRLEGLEGRKPGELSGGQQQRVALARALVIRPRCLLLDEPLSNLDAKLRHEMRGEIRALCKSAGLTSVYVTHDQKEALAMADRVALMREGRVVQCDTPQGLYRAPATRFAAEFVGEANFLRAQVLAADDRSVTLRTPLGPCVVPRALAPKSLGRGADAEVTCALRPEAIRLGTPAGGGNGSVWFQAGVSETTYLGEVAQHVLKTAGELQLRVLELNPTGSPLGGTTHAWFRSEDLIVLGDEDERWRDATAPPLFD